MGPSRMLSSFYSFWPDESLEGAAAAHLPPHRMRISNTLSTKNLAMFGNDMYDAMNCNIFKKILKSHISLPIET